MSRRLSRRSTATYSMILFATLLLFALAVAITMARAGDSPAVGSIARLT